MQQQTLLSFTIAGRRLALPLASIRYVAPVPLLLPPIAAPHFVEGFFDFQGAPIAAIRLDRLFDLGDGPLGLYTPLLILADIGHAVALHVERVDGIRKINASMIQPIDDSETLNGCVVGRIDDRGDTIYLLAPPRLMIAAERERLASLRAMTHRRLEALDSDAVHTS